MADREQLAQRYADLLELDAAFLPLVAELDAAAAPFRTLEPPPALDQAIEQLAHQRQHNSANGTLPEAIEPTPPSAPPASARHILPERLRGDYTHQLLGMAAAIVVLVLFAGLVAALLRGPGGQSEIGAGGVASPSATTFTKATVNTSGQDYSTFDQAQQLAPFYIAEPQWLPSYLAEPVIMIVPPARDGTMPSAQQIHAVDFGYEPVDRTQKYSIGIVEHGGTFTVNIPNATMMTIAGHAVTHGAESNGTVSLSYYLWQDQGTTFQLTAEIAGPLTEQDVERIIASMLVGDGATPQATASATISSLPTPNANGLYLGLTFEQAQQLAPFRLYMPTNIPSSLKYDGISLELPPFPIGGVPKGVPTSAQIRFRSTDDPSWLLEIDERWLYTTAPATPAAPAVTSPSGTPPVSSDQALPSTFQIGDVTVTKDAGANAGGVPVASYKWIQGKTILWLIATHFDVHESEIYNMIASMIAQGS